jgi:uncharacterized protein
MTPSFAVDRMLGGLARMLRLLGYDALYSPAITVGELRESAEPGGRIVLTRGRIESRFASVPNVHRIASEVPAEQLREVVRRWQLDTHSGLWTRCTLCNGRILPVEKASIEAKVPAKVFHIYNEFFHCTGCDHVYWKGSHTERILRNLGFILNVSPD